MHKYDLVVVGGGIAGVSAAVSAAREGLSVIIIEKFGCLGGALSNSLVYPFTRFRTLGPMKKTINGGIFTEIRERHAQYGDLSWETFKFVFDDMVEEAGVDVLFHSTVYKADSIERNIKKIYVATKSGTIEIEANFFVDASGDGELIAMTGCDYQLGREQDNFCQPMTTCFRIGGVDVELFQEELPELQEKYKLLREQGEIKNPRENILVFFGLGKDIVHFNTTRVIKHNPVDAFEVSKAEMLARKQVYEVFSFLKNNSLACKDASIIDIAGHIGVRESRKLKGAHILTADELINFANYDDIVALGNYDIDIHNPVGTGTTIYKIRDDKYYRIPYRSLLPKEYDNMLVAGRCVSATHEAHSSVRVMPICASMGEAVGKAIAVANETGKNVHTLNIDLVKDKLINAGAAIE